MIQQLKTKHKYTYILSSSPEYEEKPNLIIKIDNNENLFITLIYNNQTTSLNNLTYDLNGNLQSGFAKYYEYNNFNQLKKTRNNNASGTLLEEYWYDQDGNRIKKYDYTKNETTYYVSKNLIQIAGRGEK